MEENEIVIEGQIYLKSVGLSSLREYIMVCGHRNDDKYCLKPLNPPDFDCPERKHSGIFYIKKDV